MLFSLYLYLLGWWRASARASSLGGILICLSKKCPWLMSYGVMKLIIGHRGPVCEWAGPVRDDVTWKCGSSVAGPVRSVTHRMLLSQVDTADMEIWSYFSFQFKTWLYVDFPLYMQISKSMHYFTSLEVTWLVHAADWKWPLRKYINYSVNGCLMLVTGNGSMSAFPEVYWLYMV